MTRRRCAPLLLIPLAALGGAAAAGIAPGGALADPIRRASCEVLRTDIALPESLEESSGLAIGWRDPAVFWSHNDGGNDARVVGFDREGKQVAAFEVESPNRDWEAMDIGSCEFGSCLYLADTGDNDEERDEIALLRMSEPGTDVTGIDPRRYDLALPDGPRDIEAMYVLPGGRIFFVTKGRNHPITVYRYPGPLIDGEEAAVLQEIQSLGPAANPLEWVTGAGATRDGRFVAIRSYATLYLYRVLDDGRLELLPDGRVGLLAVREAQGEAVAFAPDGTLYLTSERRNAEAAKLTEMTCELE